MLAEALAYHDRQIMAAFSLPGPVLGSTCAQLSPLDEHLLDLHWKGFEPETRP
jgi:hypothetical protein